MNTSSSSIRALLVGLAFLGVGAVAHAQGTPGPVRIGALLPLTGQGSANGIAQLAGLRMAATEINAAGGILRRQVEIVVADEQSDPTSAVTEAKRLAFQDKVDAIWGPPISQEVLAVLPVFTEAKLLQLTTAGSALLTPQSGPYHFALLPSIDAQGVAMVNFVSTSLRSKAPAILADNGGQSKTGVAAMLARAKELNLPIVAQQEFSFRTNDMTPQLLALRRVNADALLVMVSIPDDLAAILRGIKDLGWDVRVVGGQAVGAYSGAVGKDLGSDVFEKVAGQSLPGYTYCSTDKLGDSEYARWMVKFKTVSPDVARTAPLPIASYGYGGLYIFKAIMEATGTTDGPTNAAWIEKNAASIPNFLGKFSASPSTHFLLGPDSLPMLDHPERFREDGLQKRAGC